MPAAVADRPRTGSRPKDGHAADPLDHLLDVVCMTVAGSVAALIPIARGLGVDSQMTTVVPALALGMLLLGRAAVPLAGVAWASAVPLIGFAAFAGGPESVKAGVPLILMCSVVPFALRGLQVRVPHLKRVVATAFVVTQTFSALVGIVQFTGARPLGIVVVFGRAQGVAGHPNVLGLMSGITVLVLLDRLVRGRGPRALGGLVLAVNLVALIASGSLSALGATVIGVALQLWVHRRVSVVVLLILTLLPVTYVAAAFVPLLGSLVQTIEYRFGVVSGSRSDGGAASIETRSETYQWAIDYLRESPVYGVGLQREVSGTFNGTTVVHNFFLRAWYQGGITHALWFVLLLTSVVARVILPAIGRRTRALALPASGVALILAFAATAAFWGQAEYWLPLLFFITMVDRSPAGSATDRR